MGDDIIVTSRLKLRRVGAADVDLLHSLDNDPEVMRFINGGIPVARDVIEREILPTFLAHDPALGFRVVELVEGDPVGWCCLRGVDCPEGEASLGYRLASRAWGNGYANEAARAMLRAGFHQGITRVVATTYEENAPSIRVLEKLGFSPFRKFRPDLEQQTTAVMDTSDPWPGWDLEFELVRDAWQDLATQEE